MRSAILILILIIGRTVCSAQSVDGNLLGGSIDLGSKWLYHEGDNTRWARPDLPDADWKPVSTEVGSYARSSTPDGFFWYRLHVRIPAAHVPLRMLVDETGNPYEVFANGIKIGGLGQFPPDALRLRNLVQTFDIPAAAATGDSLVIAFRFWNRSNDWGGLRGLGQVLIGSHDDIKSAFAAERGHIMAYWIPDICVRFLSLALAGGLLVLYRWNPQLKEYPWIATYFFAMTALTVLLGYRSVAPIDLRLSMFLDLELMAVGYASLLQFAFAFLRRNMPIWLRFYQLSLIFQPLVMYAAFRGWANGSAADLAILIWNLPYAFLLPGIVFWRYFRGQGEAGLLAIPLLLINLNDIMRSAAWLLYETGVRRSSAAFIKPFSLGPVRLYVGQIEVLLFALSIGALLLHRFHRTSQEAVRAESELEAARSMQEVMVPKRLHQVAGFAVESAYIPAQEVGGDFFQLHPCEDGSLLIVIGDVSGKGLKAAMLVSMILGVLQRSIEITRSPGQVLADLNRCLMGQMDGKFATCCCALILQDGSVRAANAGHLSPYCDGIELELPGGLPLGMCADASYEEVELHLPAGKRWLFISDGVVEARSKSGELYGFERTRSISILAVNQIAQTVQEFGQEDDITVLGIQRQAAYA